MKKMGWFVFLFVLVIPIVFACNPQPDPTNLVLNGDMECDLDENGWADNWTNNADYYGAQGYGYSGQWANNPENAASKVLVLKKVSAEKSPLTQSSLIYQDIKVKPNTWYELKMEQPRLHVLFCE